jgi:hypothetical protein
VLGCGARANPARPSELVYSVLNSVTQIVSVNESLGGSTRRSLSTAGVDTSFVLTLPGDSREVLLVERGVSGDLITGFVRVRVTTGEQAGMGQLKSNPSYVQVAAAIAADADHVVVELGRAGSADSDLVLLAAGHPPTLLAAGAGLVAVAAGRVAYLRRPGAATQGDLASVGLDGSTDRPLGGGDGQDRVVAVSGERLLVDLHTNAATTTVRLCDTSGNLLDLATGMQGFALTQGGAILTTTQGGATQALAGSSAADVHPITSAVPGLVALGTTPADELIYAARGGLWLARPGAGTLLLDGGAGQTPFFGTATATRVIYTAAAPGGFVLRAAALDGSGVVDLFAAPNALPLWAAFLDEDHAVAHVTSAGAPEGGELFGLQLAGSPALRIGDRVASGGMSPLFTADQDFEAVTALGNVVYEAEFPDDLQASQLLLTGGNSAQGDPFSTAGTVRFRAAVP